MIRVFVYRIAILACLLIAALEASSEAAEDVKPLKERWIPGISLGLVVFEDDVKGTIDNPIEFSDAGSKGTTVARLQLGLNLMSPSLPVLPAGPRLVGFAGLQIMGPNEENESAGAGGFPDLQSVEDQVANATIPNANQPGVFPPPDSFKDQGSILTTTRNTMGWYLGMGLAFEFPDRENEDPALRLRPFVKYVGEQLDLDGRSVIVQGQPCCVPTVGSYSIFSGSVSRVETLHYLGPGIDAELVVASYDSATISLFASVSFLWNVGDSSIAMTDGARYTYKVDEFTVRPGGGLRMAWRGGL
jgi:hypothetical protein